jgi:hypothetical protein
MVTASMKIVKRLGRLFIIISFSSKTDREEELVATFV